MGIEPQHGNLGPVDAEILDQAGRDDPNFFEDSLFGDPFGDIPYRNMPGDQAEA